MDQSYTLKDLVRLDTQSYRKFQDQLAMSRWTDNHGFPPDMQIWFKEGISKHRGDDWENGLIQSCPQLLPKINKNHDAVLNEIICQELRGYLLEIKFFTVMLPDPKKKIIERGYALTWAERATNIPIVDGKVLPAKKGTWQQVKPEFAHYGLFSALYGNGAVHYWVPYHLLCRTPGKDNYEPGKIPMGIQHKGSLVEGQVDINPRFHELFFLDYTIGTPFITDLSKYDLSKYENLVY
jgi:hypothetical protein